MMFRSGEKQWPTVSENAKTRAVCRCPLMAQQRYGVMELFRGMRRRLDAVIMIELLRKCITRGDKFGEILPGWRAANGSGPR